MLRKSQVSLVDLRNEIQTLAKSHEVKKSLNYLIRLPAMNLSKGSSWKCALELKPDRSVAAGSYEELCSAIRRGADLRVYTEFLHEEHIAPFSPNAGCRSRKNDGLIREVIDFRETLLIDDRHVAGITLLRQPMEPTTGFNGAQPRMAFFLYNMDGHQACANLILDGSAVTGKVGTRTINPTPTGMPKLSEEEMFDVATYGPSRNFIYDMEVYRSLSVTTGPRCSPTTAKDVLRSARSTRSNKPRSKAAR